MNRSRLCLLFFALTTLGFAAGPTGKLYLTVSNGAYLDSLQGDAESLASTAVGGEGPIAVFGRIATTGTSQGRFGASYDLGGAFAGDLYASGVPSNATDATTDGASNYVLNDRGAVYATAADFSAATPLFSTGFGQGGGITFDPMSGALWIASGGFLTSYDLLGNARDVFALADTGVLATAYDPLDGTLWTGSGTLLSQYTKTGSLLQTISLGSGLRVVGMEFDLAPAPVPEPASFAVLGLGLVPLLARRKRP